MDWQAAIERNRMALEKVLAGLIALAGLAVPTGFTSPLRGGRREAPGGGCGLTATLPRHLHLLVLRLLRPAESAARRLVIAFARDIVVALPPRRPRLPKRKSAFLSAGIGTGTGTGILMPSGFPGTPRVGSGRSAGPPALPLFDVLRRPADRHPARRGSSPGVPRISVPGHGAPFPVAVRRLPLPDDPVDVSRLMSRLAALGAALDDLPGHALRFARWQASRDAAGAQSENRDAACAQSENHDAAGAQRENRAGRLWPLRHGRPPGARGRRGGASHPVDALLADANWLAFMALERRDTS